MSENSFERPDGEPMQDFAARYVQRSSKVWFDRNLPHAELALAHLNQGVGMMLTLGDPANVAELLEDIAASIRAERLDGAREHNPNPQRSH
ncbi:hypothetical protein [Terrihabitans sp. B22-R8]|uniref:hypothetical protein n=1 Tax=Terrihabitans sp. B22-R8 TaxID=3425128 RepID=UPI00403CA0F2